MKKGSTLIELLVGMTIFTVLVISVTLSITATLRSSSRAAEVAKVKSDGAYIMDAMSNVIRYAQNVQCGTQRVSVTHRSSPTPIVYECFPGTNPRIEWNSTAMNSMETKFTSCNIVCDSNSSKVEIDFRLQDINEVVINPVNFNSQVVLRNK